MTYSSVLKTTGEPYTNKTIDLRNNTVSEVTIEPATEEEIAAAKGAIRTLGGKIVKVGDYTIPTSGVTHRVVVIEKVSPTPPRYPRAFAKIKKQPL